MLLTRWACRRVSRFQRPAGGEQRATTLELFYDLVFVFAITQVSQFLLAHLTATGVAEAALVLLVVWWAWNYTTWVTNELDVESTVVRLWKRLGGAIACVAVAAAGSFAPSVVLAALVVVVLVAVIGLEQQSGAKRRARGEPSPLERLAEAPDLDRAAGDQPA
jgi:hypothetical protein